MKGDFATVHADGVMDLSKPSIYLYPITPFMYTNGSNDYILRIKEMLGDDFTVVNKVTRLGILDIILKLHKCDVIYFNWIADIADRRFGHLQMLILFFILSVCKLCGIKIAWFIHNDLSHSAKNRWAKKLIRRMMMVFADLTLSHSKTLSIAPKISDLKVFEHPVDQMRHIEEVDDPGNDLLVWGAVSPYKGVSALARYNFESDKLGAHKIVVAGKFSCDRHFEETRRYTKQNIRFSNKVQSTEELETLFRNSRYVLFCYSSRSVVSSAALCKSLSYGKTIIGPAIGSFKDLGSKGLIYTYETFEEMAELVTKLKEENRYIDKQLIRDYIQSTSWENFGRFLRENLYATLGHTWHPAFAT